MKIDFYTKSILTVIAGSLVWLCIQDNAAPRVVSAQGPQKAAVQKVEIVGSDGSSIYSLEHGMPVVVIGQAVNRPIRVFVVNK